MEQRTEEWFNIRLGKVTGSRVADVMARTKTGFSASRTNYMYELLVERMTGKRQEGYTNAAMQHGIDFEPVARAAYEGVISGLVHEVGFVSHSALPDFGCSPDGLVGSDGLVEIKCPNTAQHVDTMLSGFPSKYQAQVQAQMACTERLWCDFVSFDPRMPDTHQLVVIKVLRDDEFIEEMEGAIDNFLQELSALRVSVDKVDKFLHLLGWQSG